MGTASRAVAVGFFVVVGFLLFGLALFLIGDRKRLFEQSFVCYAEFERLAGLQEGARVRVGGLDAGQVTEISYPQSPDARFRVGLRVIEDLHGLVRTDSVALIQTEGLVGNMLVEIGEGSAEAPPVPEGGTIQSREPFEIADLMTKASELSDTLSDTVVTLGEELTITVHGIETAVNRVDGLVAETGADVMAMTRSSRAVAEDVESLVADVRAGRGTVGKLLNDDILHRRVEAIAANLEQVSADAEVAFENVRAVSEEAKETFEGFRTDGPNAAPGLLTDLSRTLEFAREAASDISESTESMKRSFLFRGMFLERGFFDLDALTPDQYAKGALGGKHHVRRFWIDASDLVETGPDGREVMSTLGVAKIRSAMSEVLRYPPTSPLIVEGYEGSGSLDERYLKAHSRAYLVRDYIVREFHRDANYTGFIALGAMSPNDLNDGPSEDVGDSGVYLALYYEEEVPDLPRPRVIQ
jgi:phospholipid/cholesterol/gamma-HCH transport system substrate-binding protein